MKILVTGSTGAVGRRVCALLADAGHEVVGVDRRSSVRPAPGVELVTADLAVTDLRQLLTGVDTVVHLASGLRPQEAGADPGHAIPAVAQRLLAALEDSAVTHLVVLSTAMVYGARPDNPVP
ncbi:MAG: NAD-dependent epimerase/dehydratase family protein, partial [Acidimicrobiales bacterium]|nr:NAD-dependent epimerase/dehydratase family protein [Acidimicrobiales bacterium]